MRHHRHGEDFEVIGKEIWMHWSFDRSPGDGWAGGPEGANKFAEFHQLIFSPCRRERSCVVSAVLAMCGFLSIDSVYQNFIDPLPSLPPLLQLPVHDDDINSSISHPPPPSLPSYHLHSCDTLASSSQVPPIRRPIFFSW
jgi:hypothetical protein